MKAETVGVAQPGEKKAARRHYGSLPVELPGGQQESWGGTLCQGVL